MTLVLSNKLTDWLIGFISAR